jgi:hypothetical protein
MTSVQYLSDLALLALARRAMRREQVPRHARTRPASGRALARRAPFAMIRSGPEIEMRFCPDRGCAIITVYPVHAPCFWIWQAERPAA